MDTGTGTVDVGFRRAPSKLLWSTAEGTQLAEVAARLGLNDLPRGELGVGWESTTEVMDDLASLGFPDDFGKNWDAANECVADLVADGYLLLISGCEHDETGDVGRVVDLFAHRWGQEGPVVVVLAGWPEDSIEADWPGGRSISHPVQRLTS